MNRHKQNSKSMQNMSQSSTRISGSRNSTEETSDFDTDMVDSMDAETQRTLLRTFEQFYEQESEIMLAALEQSREDIKSSMIELVDEQERFKEELVRVTDGKFLVTRKKENSIPLAEYLRKKRGLDSRNSVIGKSPESLSDQHPSDKMAVERYLRKRERQKAAEDNRITRELTDLNVESETRRLISKLGDMDLSKEKERERQLEKVQQKLKSKTQAKDDHEVATEIIETYQDSQLAYERDKRMQQRRFQERLSAARDRRALTPTGREFNSSDMTSFQSREKTRRNSKLLTVPSRNVPLIDI